MSELIPKLAAVGYHADQLGRLVADLQGLQYSLMNVHRWCLNNAAQIGVEAPSAQSLAYMAGTAAALRSRLEHALRAVEQLTYSAEELAPKGRT